jgi:hypothetical protein
MDKPDLIEVVSRYIELRKAGREYRGLAPCHPDHHPSGRYNEEKQKWFCDPCGRGGDVIDFVMLIDGLTFTEACKTLGIDSEPKLRPALTDSRKRSAKLAAAWARYQREKLNSLIAESFEQRDLADEIADSELGDIFDREIILLCGFYDAMRHPHGVAELLAVRASIEQITVDAEIIHVPPSPELFPPLTAEYLAKLNEHHLDFEGCFR